MIQDFYMYADFLFFIFFISVKWSVMIDFWEINSKMIFLLQ